MRKVPVVRSLAVASLFALLAGCGGGGDGNASFIQASAGNPGGGSSGGNGGGGVAPPPAWSAGVFQSPSTFEGRCAAPRSGNNPVTGRPWGDVAGSVTWENDWLRAFSNDLYLWYRELPDLNPASYTSTAAYFDLLKTSATTPSGNPKDRFHFTYPTDVWIALSGSGVSVGYGAEFALIASRPPRRIVVAFTEASSAAANAGLRRGTEIVTVDGVDAVNANDAASIDRLNDGLFPDAAGSHTFGIRDPGSSTVRTVTMTAGQVTSAPVRTTRTFPTATGVVGYLLFNDHIATAERQLVDAIEQFRTAGVADLVLDLRYNGGGFLDLASELAYMIAGPGRTSGRTFERLTFNDKYPTTNPVTGSAIAPTPFHSTARGFSVTQGTALPTLNLSRVFVLAGPGTCSASESIVNSLRGVDVEVVLIGGTSCGKPYGFYPEDNCGTTYFTIQFVGTNAKDFGDYTDGFSPNNTTASAGVRIPGCAVADDFSRELGDPLEGRLAAALSYRLSSSCPAATVTVGLQKAGFDRDDAGGLAIGRENPLDNRLMRR